MDFTENEVLHKVCNPVHCLFSYHDSHSIARNEKMQMLESETSSTDICSNYYEEYEDSHVSMDSTLYYLSLSYLATKCDEGSAPSHSGLQCFFEGCDVSRSTRTSYLQQPQQFSSFLPLSDALIKSKLLQYSRKNPFFRPPQSSLFDTIFDFRIDYYSSTLFSSLSAMNKSTIASPFAYFSEDMDMSSVASCSSTDSESSNVFSVDVEMNRNYDSEDWHKETKDESSSTTSSNNVLKYNQAEEFSTQNQFYQCFSHHFLSTTKQQKVRIPKAKLVKNDYLYENLCYSTDVTVQRYMRSAFKYTHVFEILSRPLNRFFVSPYSYGLGLPLFYLNTVWSPLGFYPGANIFKAKTRFTFNRTLKKSGRSEVIRCQSNSTSPAIQTAIPTARSRLPVKDRNITDQSIQRAFIITEELSRNHRDETPNSIHSIVPKSAIISAHNRFELSTLDVLSEEIWFFHKSITQTDSVLNRKLHLRDVLYYAISPVFPMCGLYVVGSSLNGFGTYNSDMDLCLMITNKDLDQRTDAVVVLNMIQTALSDTKWVSNMQLILAKVPILRIRFHDPFTDITVDLNANNSVAIRNTHLLCYYSSFDWRVRPLVSVVKEWAKRRDINDANRSSFTSYSLVLMVIHYLQCGLEQPILPSLQLVYPKRFSPNADVRSLNVSSHLEPPPGWIPNETVTLGELLIGFLEYYAFKFDYLKDAISVRLGSKTERTVVARQPSPYNCNIAQWNCICIEEPFTLSNTAHSVHNQMVFDAIRQAFVDGCYELDANRDLMAFLNSTPIKVHIGAPISSTAPSNNTVHLEAGSSASISSGDDKSGRLSVTSEVEKEQYELVEHNRLDERREIKLQNAAEVFPQEKSPVEVDNRQKYLASSKNDMIDKENGGTTPKSLTDSIENVLPSGVEPENTIPVLNANTTTSSYEKISKNIFTELQPNELQLELFNQRIKTTGSTETVDSLISQQELGKQQVAVNRANIQQNRKGGRRMYGSSGCENRKHLDKSNAASTAVQTSYNSGTASS